MDRDSQPLKKERIRILKKLMSEVFDEENIGREKFGVM